MGGSQEGLSRVLQKSMMKSLESCLVLYSAPGWQPVFGTSLALPGITSLTLGFV